MKDIPKFLRYLMTDSFLQFDIMGFCLQTAILLLRIDDIVSGTKKADDAGPAAGGRAEPAQPPPQPEE